MRTLYILMLAIVLGGVAQAEEKQSRAAVDLITESTVVINRPATAIWPHILDINDWKQGNRLEHVAGGAGGAGETFASVPREGSAPPRMFVQNVEIVPNLRRTIKMYSAADGALIGHASWELKEVDGVTTVTYRVYTEALVPGQRTADELAGMQQRYRTQNDERFQAELVALKKMVEAKPLTRVVPSREALQGLEAEVAAALETFQVPGIAIGVIQDGRVVFAKGFGVQELGKSRRVDADTIFAIASVTKSFTAAALSTLVDEGKLQWDRPVREYLPDFRLYEPVATEQITARDMVAHLSGLPRHDFIRVSTHLERAELVRRLRYLPPNRSFREGYQYSNLMYVAAGYLGGVIAGQSWEDLVEQRILAPLQMNRSSTSVTSVLRAQNHASPHLLRDGKAVVTDFYDYQKFGIGPNGAVNSTVHDLLKYLQMYLDDGRVDGRQVLSSAQLQELFTPMGTVSPGVRYSLGWFVETRHGERTLSHAGGVVGFSSHVVLVPERKLGIVILGNLGPGRFPAQLAWRVADRFMGVAADEPVVAPGVNATKPPALSVQPPVSAPAPSDLSVYTGNWFHPAYGRVRVMSEAQRLAVKFDAITLWLDPQADGTFRDQNNRVVQFRAGISKRADEMVLPLEPAGPDFVFTRQLRLAAGFFQHETTTFSPQKVTLADFPQPDLDGAALLKFNGALQGFTQFAREHVAVEVVPLRSPGGLPNSSKGWITRQAFEHYVERMIADLRSQLPVDGVYLSLHGAAAVEGVERPEAELARRIREVVGPDVPIAGTFDPHGNEDEAFLRYANFSLAEKYFPHYDSFMQGERAARVLIRAARGDYRSTTATRRPGIISPTVMQWTGQSPWSNVIQRALTWEAREPDVYVSVFFGFPWSDVPDVGATVQVMANGNQALADEIADDMSAYMWRMRRELVNTTPIVTPSDAVQQALDATKIGNVPVVLADYSDRTGDATHILAEIIERDLGGVIYATLRDERVMDALKAEGAKAGDSFDRDVGGFVLSPDSGKPVRIRGRLVYFGTPAPLRKELAIVEFGRGNWLVLSRELLQIKSPDAMRWSPVDPERFTTWVIKSRVHFRAGFDDTGYAKRILIVDAPGPYLGTVHLDALPYRHASVKQLFPYRADEP